MTGNPLLDVLIDMGLGAFIGSALTIALQSVCKHVQTHRGLRVQVTKAEIQLVKDMLKRDK